MKGCTLINNCEKCKYLSMVNDKCICTVNNVSTYLLGTCEKFNKKEESNECS